MWDMKMLERWCEILVEQIGSAWCGARKNERSKKKGGKPLHAVEELF